MIHIVLRFGAFCRMLIFICSVQFWFVMNLNIRLIYHHFFVVLISIAGNNWIGIVDHDLEKIDIHLIH